MFLNPQDIVVITGAASGMGRAYAIAFARLNCRLALCDIDENGLDETCNQVAAFSKEACLRAVVNIAEVDSVNAFAQRVNRELGPARVVINNAGIEGSAQPSWQTPLAMYEKVMAVNYFGVVHGCRSFLPQLLTYQRAWLVNISSVFGLIGTPNHTDYCGSKFAVRGYTEALRAELNGSGVHVMLVHPGGVNTRIARQDISRPFAEQFLKSTPEQVVKQVLRAMANGRARVVCGHNSWKTALAARLLPLGLLSRLIWRELSGFIDSKNYPPPTGALQRDSSGDGPKIEQEKTMKKMLILLGGLIIAAVIWSIASYPRIGSLVYEVGVATEAAVYGFEKKQQPLGELDMVYYAGGNTDGPTIVMLHGYSADKMVWLRFARHLTDSYHILIPDLAGHGETGFQADWDYTMAAQAERVVALLDALNIEQAHIIGNSMGGFISGQFALDYPQRTLSIAPVDPAGVTTPEPSDMEKMLAEGRNPFLIENGEQFAEFYQMTMAKPPWLPGMVLDAMAEDYRVLAPQLEAIFEDIQRSPLLADRLGELQVPALILWGDQDALIHVSGAERWHALIPDSQLTVWEGIGHMPMLEIPEASAQRYRAFLARGE